MTTQLKDKAKSSLLEMKGKVEQRSKVEEFKSRVAMSRGQHRFLPYEGTRQSQRMVQHSLSVDDGPSQSVAPQRWGNDLNLSEPEFSNQSQEYQGQHGIGVDSLTTVQRRRMMMKNLYQSKVQGMAKEKNLSNQDLYSIKQEVVLEVMNLESRLTQDWSYCYGGVGMENNFQNNQMGLGQGEMGMGQNGMGMGQGGMVIGQAGMGMGQAGMGMGQGGMPLGQGGMGMGFGHGAMGFGQGNAQSGMGVNGWGLCNGLGGMGFGGFQFQQENVQGGMGWGQCGGGGGSWS